MRCRKSATVIILLLTGHAAFAADPVAYTVKFLPSGDAVLDGLLKQTASLVSLQKKLPPAPFALIGRAQADQAQFLIVLRSLGYDSGTVAVSIDGKDVGDPTLVDTLTQAPAKPPVEVLVTPHKGALYHLHEVTFATLPHGFVPPATIKPGDPALAAPVLAASGTLQTALHNAGYAFATVSAPLAVADGGTDTLDVTYTIAPGPRVDIGAISFAGIGRTDEAFLRRHILLHPGEQYSDTTLADARDSLLGLGVFASVTPVPSKQLDARGQVPIIFRMVEQKRHAVTVGVSYATDTGVTVSSSWEDRNLFRHAETLTVTAAATGGGTDSTAPGYDLKGVFAKPDYDLRGQTLSYTAEAVRQSLTAYDRTAFVTGPSISKPLTKHITLNYGLSFTTENIFQEAVSRNYVLLQLPLGVTYNNTDSVLEPTKGVNATVSITPTEAVVGSRRLFFIMQGTASTYIAVERDARGVVAVRGLVGSIQGASQFQVPADQRFYAGGSGTIRGYSYQTVGPLFADDTPEGGNAIDAVSVEFRQHIGKSFGVVPFVDAGQASAGSAPFTGKLRVGVGIGARYYTAIGPIRIDIATPLSRTPGSGAFALYIGLGEAF